MGAGILRYRDSFQVRHSHSIFGAPDSSQLEATNSGGIEKGIQLMPEAYTNAKETYKSQGSSKQQGDIDYLGVGVRYNMPLPT